MSSDLYLAGVLIDRVASLLTLGALELSIDRPDTLHFSELRVAGGPGSWSEGDSCRLDVDGTTYLLGQIVSAHPSPIGGGSISVAYTALGLRFLVNNLFITAADFTGFMSWNLPSTDPEFTSSNSGQTVGQILKQVFDQHQTALASVGLTAAPPYDAGELAALDVVPPEPVVLSGRLVDACCDLLAQWCPKYALWPSAADGRFHCVNTLALPQTTLTLDSDPITLDSLGKTHGECFTQVIVRGAADIQGAYLSLKEGTLRPRWTMEDQLKWTIKDFYAPKDAADIGDILSQTSDQITIKSDDPLVHWITNYWNGISAEVWAYNPLSTSLSFSEQRVITAATALSAGGTATLTVDRPWNNTGYTRYVIRGSRTELSLVWRGVDIVPDYVAFHLARRFNHAVHWSPTDGVDALTWLPVGNVCWMLGSAELEFPAPFEVVLPDGANRGYLVFLEPLPKAYDSQADLQDGGSHVVPPADVKVLVPYSRGALEARAPAGGYEGTAWTVDGVQRTLYRDVPEWLDSRDSANMTKLAQEILDSYKDTIIEGRLTCWGKSLPWLTLGKALNIARSGGTTGWEALAAPVRSVSLHYQEAPVEWVTRLEFSTRRRPFSGDRLYIRPRYGAAGNLALAADLGAGMWQVQSARSGAMKGAIGAALEGPGEGDVYIPPWATAGPQRQGMTAAEYNRGVAWLTGEGETLSAQEYNRMLADFEKPERQTEKQKQRERIAEKTSTEALESQVAAAEEEHARERLFSREVGP